MCFNWDEWKLKKQGKEQCFKETHSMGNGLEKWSIV